MNSIVEIFEEFSYFLVLASVKHLATTSSHEINAEFVLVFDLIDVNNKVNLVSCTAFLSGKFHFELLVTNIELSNILLHNPFQK